jgi:pantoate--beta-alanine ligase
VAVFGEKDWQQLQVIRRMAGDLGMPLRIVGAPTRREADGLALSSRNQYLQPQERVLASRLHAALQAVGEGLRRGRRDFEALCGEQRRVLEGGGFRPQYLEVRAPDLSPPRDSAPAYIVLVAAHLGATRLIDNLQVRIGE